MSLCALYYPIHCAELCQSTENGQPTGPLWCSRNTTEVWSKSQCHKRGMESVVCIPSHLSCVLIAYALTYGWLHIACGCRQATCKKVAACICDHFERSAVADHMCLEGEAMHIMLSRPEERMNEEIPCLWLQCLDCIHSTDEWIWYQPHCTH